MCLRPYDGINIDGLELDVPEGWHGALFAKQICWATLVR